MKNKLVFSALFLSLFISACNTHKHTTVNSASLKRGQEDGMREALKFEHEKTADPQTGEVPIERLVSALEYAKKVRKEHSKRTRASVSNVVWSERGPNNVGGRTRCIMYDKNDPTNKTVFAGSVGGGLWKTMDITATTPIWTKSNDFFENLAITSLVQDPTNYNVMYFGTGEGFGNSDAIRGLGIWKSIDGGSTWHQLPATNNSSFYYVQKLMIRNNGDLFAATNDGLQKSDNNGASFTKVIGNGISGANFDFTYDVEIGANEDIYVATESELFKSNHGTFLGNTGNVGTWTNISPSGIFQRSEFFTAPSDPNIVYVMCNDFDSVSQILRSSDAGLTWVQVTKPGFCDQGFAASDFTRGQAWYDLIGAVDPNDPNTIYIGGIDALKSSDGGLTWTQITSWSGGGAFDCVAPNVFVHADHHAIVFNGNNSNDILWGTDGGVYRTVDSGNTFEAKIANYNVTQYYGCAIHPLQRNYFLAGAQDNGTQRFTSAGINSTTDATGGDGMFCHIDQKDGKIQFTSYYNNFYNLSTDGGNTFTFIGGDGSGRFVNPTDYDNVNKVFYGAYTPGFYELVSDIGGANTFSNRDISAVVDGRTATAVKVDPNNPSTVWMGFRSLTLPCILVRIDSAFSVTPMVTVLSNGLPTDVPIYLSNIDIEKGNSNHLLVSYSNYGINSIYETIDGGLTWNSIEGNMPDMPVRWVILHPDSNDMAFAATELGVWSTTNLDGAATNWTQTNDSLANVSVHMLQYRPSDHVLAAATHGRGLFTASLPHTPVLNFDALVLEADESPASNDTCRKFKEYSVNMMTSILADTAIHAEIKVKAGATATEGLDFDYTTNGSFTTPSHKIEFSTPTVTIPLTIRIYDDAIHEPILETFTCMFDSISANATAGMNHELSCSIQDNSDDPAFARQNIWTEDFESGTNPPANWNLVGTDVNQFGNQNFVCPSTIQNFTMQVYNTTLNACGYDNVSASDAIVYRVVQADNFKQLKINFDWTGEGEGGYDWGELVYSTDTTTPNWIVVQGASPLSASSVMNSTFDLPSLLDSTSFLIGWHWLNDFSVGGSAFAVDNISVSGITDRFIETTIASNEEYLGSYGEAYFYNSDGDLICRIENLSNHDYGCTKVEIDRAGNDAAFLIGETDTSKMIFEKTLRVIASNNNSTGSYRITVYVTNDELAGFETQGRSWSQDGRLFKTPDSVLLASIYTPRDTAINMVQSNFLNGSSLSGEFVTGFSGIGIGNPGKAKNPVGLNSVVQHGILVYPNPVTNYCHIRTAEKIHFQLINTLGETLRQFVVHGDGNIDVSRLSTGVYYLKSMSDGSTFKIIKQ